MKEFDNGDCKYEIWKGNLDDPAMKQMINRIQILIPLFIEGGTLIGSEDADSLDRWTIFLLYRKRSIFSTDGQTEFSYEFAGYSTVYRFFH